MAEALEKFRGTKEEQHLILQNAQLSLDRGDVERALSMLKEIPDDQPVYLEARQKMADIYLHYKKDKRQFAECFKLILNKPLIFIWIVNQGNFREIVDKNPSPQAFVMLGDAYMSIQEVKLKNFMKIYIQHETYFSRKRPLSSMNRRWRKIHVIMLWVQKLARRW